MNRKWLLCSNLVKLGAWINNIDTVMNGIFSFWHAQQYQISNHSYNNGVQKASIWQLCNHYFPYNWKFMLIIILWFRAKTNFWRILTLFRISNLKRPSMIIAIITTILHNYDCHWDHQVYWCPNSTNIIIEILMWGLHFCWH